MTYNNPIEPGSSQNGWATFRDYVKVFSYRQPQSKYQLFSQLISDSTERLQEELAKCDLICLNCHAVRLHEGKHSIYKEIQA